MNLRPARPDEAGAIARLWFESWAANGFEGHPDTREMMIERVPRELAGRWEVTVAEEDGRLLGFLALAPGEQRLDQIFIAPDAQGHGVGSALFELARSRFPDGFWLATRAVNVRARAFYERRGMALERTESGPDGERVLYRLTP